MRMTELLDAFRARTLPLLAAVTIAAGLAVSGGSGALAESDEVTANEQSGVDNTPVVSGFYEALLLAGINNIFVGATVSRDADTWYALTVGKAITGDGDTLTVIFMVCESDDAPPSAEQCTRDDAWAEERVSIELGDVDINRI